MDSGRLETVPNGTAHLDTVRALHQTVVSLRTALEVSKNELKELKEKYEKHSHCLEYADVIEKLTLENHVLRRRIIDSGYDERDPSTQNIKLEVTYSPRSQNTDYLTSEVVIQTATDLGSAKEAFDAYLDNSQGISDVNSNICGTDQLNNIPEVSESGESHGTGEYSVNPEVATVDAELSQAEAEFSPVSGEFSPENAEISPVNTERDISQSIAQDSQIVSIKEDTQSLPKFKTKLELLSKFDVRIKVCTVKEGTVVSSTTSDSDSVDEKREKETPLYEFEKRQEHFDKKEDLKGNKVNFKAVTAENIKMAVPNEGDSKKTDKFDVQVRITSEENLEIKENFERNRRKDTLNLDVDDLSLRSMSEGDNSVFSEGATTPMEPNASAEDKQEQEASGNESEEVDDIELIFTTDESKDMSNLQEDLVSIREAEQWAPNSSSTTTHSTPVLIKFHTLDPDFQPGTEDPQKEDQENNMQPIPASALKMKRVSLPNDKEIRHVAFNGKDNLELPGRGILKSCDNRSDNTLYKRSPNTSTRRLDSVDSLTCDYNRGLSLDNTKSSSFELGSSMDILHRDESVDSFHKTSHLGHRFSIFAERDISKCGTSEDDLAVSLNLRRNTCPNPFQYRPTFRPSRGGVGGGGGGGRGRCRDWTRRESAAQTDLSALPDRWGSDSYLANKVPAAGSHGRAMGASGAWGASSACRCVPCVPCVPRPHASRPRPTPRHDDARRVLLSDIGFTSMVPELSRSAEPLWVLATKHGSDEAVTHNTSKFLSRGSSYRSPCLSIDRSSDWTPQTLYVPPARPSYSPWRSSLPDVRGDDTDELLAEADVFIRRSIDNLPSPHIDGALDKSPAALGQPYIPAGPKQLRLGHTVKVITPQGKIAVGRVRYVGLAGGTASTSCVMVGCEVARAQLPSLPLNDGTHRQRRYFLTTQNNTAVFVPFGKVVMAWAN